MCKGSKFTPKAPSFTRRNSYFLATMIFQSCFVPQYVPACTQYDIMGFVNCVVFGTWDKGIQKTHLWIVTSES